VKLIKLTSDSKEKEEFMKGEKKEERKKRRKENLHEIRSAAKKAHETLRKMFTPLLQQLRRIVLSVIEKQSCQEKEIRAKQQKSVVHERNNCFRKLKKLYKLKNDSDYQSLAQ
jgi:3-methyladenine DNA glycosylase AlkD